MDTSPICDVISVAGPEPLTLPDEVADAWAAVIIDIYEKRRERTEVEDVERRAAG
jgi:hypothetical protein